MKYTDDYNAKFEIWARQPRVVRMPRIANLPKFPPQKFRSYEELQAFKKWLLSELARQGGAKWVAESGETAAAPWWPGFSAFQ